MEKNILIYDIECATNGASVKDIEKHQMRFFGAYSYRTNEYYVIPFTEREQIQALINTHKFLVGFNTNNYDNPILIQEGYYMPYKIFIDTYKVIETRQNLIVINGIILAYLLRSLSLNGITKMIGLSSDTEEKKEIDYKLFNQLEWTAGELKEIKEYTIRDIELTKKLFEWIYTEFDNWKHYLSSEDAKRLRHLYCSPSVYAYKVLAYRAGIKEEYENIDRDDEGDGGYVAYPASEKVVGDVYCFDFTSLYPHIMIQCNLYGRNKNNNGWNGNGKFKIDGYYNTEEMAKIGKIIYEIYLERKRLKNEKNPREYALKIVMNTCYGLLRNPVFKNLYDKIAGNDCCLLGQQFIKLARQRFKDAGYFVFYTDTDSVYLQDPFKDKEKILAIRDEIVKEIKQNIPFPADTFNMNIDYEIDMIHFFPGGHPKEEHELEEDDIQNQKLGLMKKNYLFVYKTEINGQIEKKLFIKNLGIVKRSNTQLSKNIFWKKMVPAIIETNNCKFSNEQINNWIEEYLKEDIKLLAKRMSVQSLSSYKNNSSLQVQAYNYIPKGQDEKLGDGIHYFIPNKKMGIGKGTKYCTIDEYFKFLTYNDLHLKTVMRELKYFNSNYVDIIVRMLKERPFEAKMKQVGLWS